jgi:hypothetical protein
MRPNVSEYGADKTGKVDIGAIRLQTKRMPVGVCAISLWMSHLHAERLPRFGG